MDYSPDGRRIVSRSWDDMVRVWDVASGECLEVRQGFGDVDATTMAGEEDADSSEWFVVIEGSGDIAAIAVGGETFPWRAMKRNLETLVEPASGGEAIAWFPAALFHIATQPSGSIWAGSVDNHLYLVRLEGEPESKSPRGAS